MSTLSSTQRQKTRRHHGSLAVHGHSHHRRRHIPRHNPPVRFAPIHPISRSGRSTRSPPLPFSTSNHEKPRITRRAISSLLLFPFLIPSPAAAAGASLSLEVDLERYTDQSEGFTLLKPASWRKVEKAGATALFEEEGKGINNIGIVVSPVRLSSLRDFGTPEFVADKLIKAERRKESTKDANVLGVAERWCQNGFPVYEIEYRVDSSRGGMKRIFSAAFVASNKLYLLNIAHSDPPDNPLDSQTREILELVLHSFDVVV